MGGKGGGVVGYRYYLGLHMVVCQKVDKLIGITVGNRILYGGKSTTAFKDDGIAETQDVEINQAKLFGGDKREGGIKGTLGVLFGKPDQVVDPYLKKMFGDYAPAFRGVFSVVCKHMYIGLNPYLKNWAFLVFRSSAPWYEEKSKIAAPDGHQDMNPAHIIWECITDRDFGMGYSASMIDDTSFRYAADVLYDEKFGLSLVWDQQSPIQEFIQQVLNHINGVLAVEPSTGRFVLNLLRADYVVDDLPHFDEFEIEEIESYQRVSWGETINEVVVQYTDRYSAKTVAITVQDLANMQIQGNIVSRTNRYKGVTNADLAYKIAQRDLQTFSTPLSKAKIIANRYAWNLNPGDPFVLSWDKLGINKMVFRVGEIDKGTLTEGKITISAVEDVFALPVSTVVRPGDVNYELDLLPRAATYDRMVEACFWDLVQELGQATATSQHPTAAFALGIAGRPTQNCTSFDFSVNAVAGDPPFDTTTLGYFSPCIQTPDLIAEDVTTIPYTDLDTDVDLIEVGDYGYIDDEMVSVAAIYPTTGVITLNRGILDTVPVAHGPSQLFITAGSYQGKSSFEYSSGETVYGRIMPHAQLGTMDWENVDKLSVLMKGRWYLPYAPGNLRLNGLRFPASLSMSATLAITFAPRNRLTQTTSNFLLQTDGAVTVEPGVTHTVTVTHETLGVLHTVPGVVNTAGMAASVLEAAAAAAQGTGTPDMSLYVGTKITVEVEAVRAGYHSYQKATATYTLTA